MTAYGMRSNAGPPPPGYGAIPTRFSNPPTPPPPQQVARSATLLARFKEQGTTLIAAQRPWAQLLDASALTRPPSAGVAITRLRRNLIYFRSNYAVALLAAVAAGFVFQPSSLLALAALVALWVLLYFSRSEQEPLLFRGRAVDDGAVVGALSVLTILAFFLTDIGSNMFRSAAVGLALVGFHALFRNSDDLFLDESEAAAGGLMAGLPVQVIRVI